MIYERDLMSNIINTLIEALVYEAPRWNTCDHEYVDNYVCNICGASPKTIKVLEDYYKIKITQQ